MRILNYEEVKKKREIAHDFHKLWQDKACYFIHDEDLVIAVPCKEKLGIYESTSIDIYCFESNYELTEKTIEDYLKYEYAWENPDYNGNELKTGDFQYIGNFSQIADYEKYDLSLNSSHDRWIGDKFSRFFMYCNAVFTILQYREFKLGFNYVQICRWQEIHRNQGLYEVLDCKIDATEKIYKEIGILSKEDIINEELTLLKAIPKKVNKI